jgi:hypothetical protein
MSVLRAYQGSVYRPVSVGSPSSLPVQSSRGYRGIHRPVSAPPARRAHRWPATLHLVRELAMTVSLQIHPKFEVEYCPVITTRGCHTIWHYTRISGGLCIRVIKEHKDVSDAADFQLLYHVAKRDAGGDAAWGMLPQSARADALYVVMKRFDFDVPVLAMTGSGPTSSIRPSLAWEMAQRRHADRDEVQLTKADHRRAGLSPKVKSPTSRS